MGINLMSQTDQGAVNATRTSLPSSRAMPSKLSMSSSSVAGGGGALIRDLAPVLAVMLEEEGEKGEG